MGLTDGLRSIAMDLGFIEKPKVTPLLPFFECVIAFTCLVYLFETYLEFRQRKYILKGPSPDFKSREGFKQEDFDLVQKYTLDKWRFGLVKDLVTTLENLAILWFRVLPWLWDVSASLTKSLPLAAVGLDPTNEVWVSTMFIYLISLESMVVNLPFSVYFTFVLEQKHGFNKQTPRVFVTDMIKGLVLTLLFVPPIFALIIPILEQTGPLMALYLWAALLALTLVMMTIYPVFIAPLFNKFTPLEDGALKSRIEALAASLKYPLAKLYVKDGSARSSHSNAYMYGFWKNKRIVLYDTLLTQSAGHDGEVVAILAHELGHWKLSHTMCLFLSQQVVMLLQFGLFSAVRFAPGIFDSFGFEGAQPVFVGLLLFQYIFTPVSSALSFGANVLSRRYEFQADAFAADLGYTADLKKALLRLEKENKSCPNVDPWYAAYHYSHPPMEERLGALTALKKD